MTSPSLPLRRFALGIVAIGLVVAILAFLFDRGRQRRGDAQESGSPAAESRLAPGSRSARPDSRLEVAQIRPRSGASLSGISGRVLEENGAPVAGATVTIEPPGAARADEAKAPIVRLQSDAAGAFEASGVEEAICDVFVEAPGFGWRALRGITMDPGRKVEVTIVLAPRVEWVGKIIDVSEQPVVGAHVTIRYGTVDFRGVRVAQVLSRTSREGGRFAFTWPGDSRLEVIGFRARKEGVGVGVWGGPRLDVPRHEFTIVMHPTRKLVVRFAPDDGSPAPAGMSVTLLADQGLRYSLETDPSGCASVLEYPNVGQAWAWVDHPAWKVPLRPPQGASGKTSFDTSARGDVEITVPLTRRGGASDDQQSPGTVEGMVVDSSGDPVEGLRVNSEFRVPEHLEAVTDRDGRFRLAGVVPATNCRVGARRGRGPLSWSSRFALAAGGTTSGVTIVMPVAPELVVEVVGIDGRNVEGIVVVAEDPDDGSPDRVRVTQRTDAAGRAELRGLPAERVLVSVDPTSLAPGVGVDDGFDGVRIVHGDDRTPLVIRLRSEVAIQGIVVLEDGTPIAGGTAQCASEANAVRYVRTSPRGEFTLAARALGDYRFSEISRVARRQGLDAPELEVFEPVDPFVLRAGRENRIVVRKRD